MSALEVVRLVATVADALMRLMPEEDRKRCRTLLAHEFTTRRLGELDDYARKKGKP